MFIRLVLFSLFFSLFPTFLWAQPSRGWQKRLNGQWMASDGFTLSFWNDKANYQTRYEYQTYQVRHDTLVLKVNPVDLPGWTGEIQFLLLERWKRDSLYLEVLQHPYEAKGTKKMLYRNVSKDRLLCSWDSLVYTSHACFGNCENFRLKIWPNGFVEYWGIYRANPLGYYTFNLDKKELNRLNGLLSSSQFEKQPTYWDLPQDLYAQTVEFYGSKGKILRAHADHFSPEFNWLCAFFQQLKKEKSNYFIHNEKK